MMSSLGALATAMPAAAPTAATPAPAIAICVALRPGDWEAATAAADPATADCSAAALAASALGDRPAAVPSRITISAGSPGMRTVSSGRAGRGVASKT